MQEREQDLTLRKGMASTVRGFEQEQRARHQAAQSLQTTAGHKMQAKLAALASGVDLS